MNDHGALSSYGAVAAGVTVWAANLETWLTITVAALTIIVLIVRLCVDIPRAWRKWRER